MSTLSVHSSRVSSLSLLDQHSWQGKPTSQRSHGSTRSVSTVNHVRDQAPSPYSARPPSSTHSHPLRVVDRNVSTGTHTSYATPPFSGTPVKTSISTIDAKDASYTPPVRRDGVPESPRQRSAWTMLIESGASEDVYQDYDTDRNETNHDENQQAGGSHQKGVGLALSFDTRRSDAVEPVELSEIAQEGLKSRSPVPVPDTAPRALKRWMSVFQPGRPKPVGPLKTRTERWSLDECEDVNEASSGLPKPRRLHEHQKSSSWSSKGFISIFKSAAAILDPSKDSQKSDGRIKSNLLRRSTQSSKFSDFAYRSSMDSSNTSTEYFDKAARDRAVQRRKILEELSSSEEGYINDLKILANVYFTILASTPCFPRSMQLEVEVNLSEILHLHEKILSQIKQVLRCPLEVGKKRPRRQSAVSKDRQSVDSDEATQGGRRAHLTRRSMESLWLKQFRARYSTSRTQDASDVAKIFGRMMTNFFVYEEYGAKYETVLHIITSASKSIPSWEAYERSIEALVNSLLPKVMPGGSTKKSLTLEDLLIKPIQRVCRYPLLFQELHKHCPATDDAAAEEEIDKVLSRLRETVNQIDMATNDPRSQARIQRSWQLQDLLRFPDTSKAPFAFRSLGHAQLCGILYVAYQSPNQFCGNYMLCALFDSRLLLAVPGPANKYFKVIAVLDTRDIQISEPDDGEGLQCHSAFFTWKLVFELDHQLYETLFCACTAREEDQWRSHLIEASTKCHQQQSKNHAAQANDFTFLSLNMRSLGEVFGPPGTFLRRISMQRAASFNPRTNACSIIIRNTHSLKDHHEPTRPGFTPLSRSQSQISTKRVPLLAPNRADRVRMEHAMANVWTKELLPFPGMTTSRGGFLVRARASSVMRKFSKASSTHSLTRTASFTSAVDDEPDPFVMPTDQYHVRSSVQFDRDNVATVRSKLEGYSLKCSPKEPSCDPDGTSRVSNIAKGEEDIRSREGSDASSVIDCSETDGVDRSDQPMKPKTLLKAFSAEGIRNWFR